MFNIPPGAYTVPITVGPEDIDALNHVNNTVYFRWVQEVATAHWFSLTTESQRNQWLWVVRRHEIDYLRPCFMGDNIQAFTWVLPPNGPGFDRIVVFKNMQTEKVITQVKTTWYLVDPVSLRSRNIPNDVLGWFSIEQPE